MPRILSIATAVPEYSVSQEVVQNVCYSFFPSTVSQRGKELLKGVFDHAGVKNRYVVEPPEYYISKPSFEDRNNRYFKHAKNLATRCIKDCLNQAGLNFENINHILSVTTTGLLTPSLEAHLAQELPFSRNVKRTPLFGVGCAGGAVALSRAADYLKGHPDEILLLLSVELCTLTFRPQDDSMIQWVGCSLFGDGAVALILCGDEVDRGASHPVEILGSESFLIPNSLDVMGWDFLNDGMRLVLSPAAPQVIEKNLFQAMDPFLKKHNLKLGDLDYFLLHPGGPKIIDACERALKLKPEDTRFTRRFLENYGNLSSASVLFVLHQALQSEAPPPGSYGILAAMGPGFACEMVLVKFL
jgi:alkylresorcinol/alkylpyrone synthase